MKFFGENLESLRELYVAKLQRLHSTEVQITEALPKMISKATDTQLKQALQSHLQETREQVTRLDRILSQSTGSDSDTKCKITATMISEGSSMVGDISDDSVRDAAIIAACQGIEHHEIAAYGTARDWAQILGEQDAAQLLEQTLEEEKHADKLLTQVANSANPRAARTAA